MQSVIGALRVVLGADIAQFEEGMQKATKRLDEISGKLSAWGAGLSVAVSAPLALMGKSFLDAASDAQEFGSAFDFLFKENAKAVREWADATGAEMGRSTLELQKMASSFMQMFKQVNPATEEGAKNASELSKQFTALAQDLSSFYNVAEDDALAKLRSGLAGESEPLRDFGVFLNEAAVQAKGLAMGLELVDGKLTDQAKVLARAALILEQTKDAQGDATRTSDSYANSVRRLAGAWNELAARLGQSILPVATRVVQALTQVAHYFAQLPEPVQQFVLVVGGIAAALGPVLTGLGLFSMALGAISGPVLAVVAAVAGAAGLIVAIAALAPALSEAASVVSERLSKIRDAFAALVERVREALGRMQQQASAVFDAIAERIAAFAAWVTQNAATVVEPLRKAWEGFSKWMNETFKKLLDALQKWVSDQIKKLTEWIDFIGGLKDKAIDYAKQIYDGIKEWLSDKLSSLIDAVKSKIASLVQEFKDAYDRIVGGSIVPDLVVEVGQWMDRMSMQMPDAAHDAAGGVVGAMATMADRLGNSLSNIGNLGAAPTPAVATLGVGAATVREQNVAISMPVQMIDLGSPLSRRQAARDLAFEVQNALKG